MQWGRTWEAGDARKKVIFPGAYCAFCRICAMYVRWCILEASLLQFDDVFDIVRCLIVHFAKEGFETPQRQPLLGFAVGAQESLF